MWQIELRHDGLQKYRVIRGTNEQVLDEKARYQKALWDAIWSAEVRTVTAHEATTNVENLLKSSLTGRHAIVWEQLKDDLKNNTPFTKPKPLEPQELVLRREPKPTDPEFQPIFTWWDKLWKFSGDKKRRATTVVFKYVHNLWEQEEKQLLEQATQMAEEYDKKFRLWEEERQDHIQRQYEQHQTIEKQEKQKSDYLNKIPAAVIDYCERVLANSEYPETFPQEYDLDYISDTGTLLIDYELPAMDKIPALKEVKYVQSRNEFVEIRLPDGAVRKLYDSVLYQICLRSIHELYDADVINVLQSIVFNGWVRSVDPSTGKEINACILSVHAKREEFLSINLANVDPKACFKALKGIGSSALHSLSPIAPILVLNREDKRFVPSYEVVDELSDTYNLAAMEWEDFEHLIREVFEKEFVQYGGEVKVTRASRDHGVDAVVFDPDVIRGGKIVIQAKRYTNTVDVSAVRDLYGTVINEGASKGILVTTADYGPDAYEFAKSKPLTLLNGSNLLHLLAKHGHKAKIDLAEAKKIIAERDRQVSS